MFSEDEMTIDTIKLLEALSTNGQDHLVKHYRDLLAKASPKAPSFLQQLKAIDMDLMKRLYKELVVQGQACGENNFDLSPLPADLLDVVEADFCRKEGLRAISEGEVAVLLLAGGQGSRLGHEGPKGTFSIGLDSGASLFELQAITLKGVSEAAGKAIPWYIMTSDVNHRETCDFFDAHKYFGYPPGAVHFFSQGMMPSVDFHNRILLAEPGEIAWSPDGNGGCFIAMKKHGVLDQLKKNGVKWLFLYGVDNAIVNVADPVFVGYTIRSGKPAASKVVPKSSPEEKVGVLCYNHGKPCIIEYSELDSELAHARDSKGNLLYGSGSILNHLLSIEALDAYMDQPLTFHLAIKKIPHWDLDLGLITPSQPNGYKYESFIFDLFPYFSDMGALQVDRGLEFAPVKNAQGEDSPETARALYLRKHGHL